MILRLAAAALFGMVLGAGGVLLVQDMRAGGAGAEGAEAALGRDLLAEVQPAAGDAEAAPLVAVEADRADAGPIEDAVEPKEAAACDEACAADLADRWIDGRLEEEGSERLMRNLQGVAAAISGDRNRLSRFLGVVSRQTDPPEEWSEELLLLEASLSPPAKREMVEMMVRSPEETIRARGIWALPFEWWKNPQDIALLERHLTSERGGPALMAAIHQIQYLDPSLRSRGMQATLRSHAQHHPEPQIRAAAFGTVLSHEVRPSASTGLAENALTDPAPEVRLAAAYYLYPVGDRPEDEALRTDLRSIAKSIADDPKANAHLRLQALSLLIDGPFVIQH
ncbi:hypothetical protein [Parvularcula oceani]|uniref:hypothetical protein n=1 Tax=Parvularcula oceani TaxID=1247963 RepID=UPI0004E0E33F|nr:hypothetical protein [Parvularcula oceani]